MKVLVLLFLIGCVSAFGPRNFQDDNFLDTAVDELLKDLIGDAPTHWVRRADAETSEYAKKIRRDYERILEQVKDMIEWGKIAKDEIFQQLKELRNKLKDLNVDIGDRAREIYNDIKEKTKEYIKTLLEKLGLKHEKTEKSGFELEVDELARRANTDEKSEYAKKIREDYERVLEQVRDMISWGKIAKDEVFEQLRELKDKLKDLNVDIGDRAREIYNQIKEKTKDYIRNLLDKLGFKHDKESKDADLKLKDDLVQHADNGAKSEYAKKIREDYERVLEQIRDMISWGKIAKDELFQQLKELRNKLKDLNVDIGDRAREIYSQIKEKTKEYIKNLLEKLGLRHEKVSRAVDLELEVNELVRRVDEGKVTEDFKDAFDKIVEKLKEAIEKNKAIKKEDIIAQLKELLKKLKEKNIDLEGKAREWYDKIKEKLKQFLKDLLEKLSQDDKHIARSDTIRGIFKKLKDALLKKLDKEAIKAKIEQLFGKGNELADQLLELLKTKGEQGKQKLLDLVERILGDQEAREAQVIQDVFDKVRDFFKNLNIELKEKYTKFGEWAKDTINNGIGASKSKIENLKAIATEFIKHAKQMQKDVAAEALEFFRAYKEDLGTLWDDLKVAVKDVFKRKE